MGNHYDDSCDYCGHFHTGACDPDKKKQYQDSQEKHRIYLEQSKLNKETAEAQHILRVLLLLPIEERRKLLEDDEHAKKLMDHK